jgi:YggT family protein
MIAVVRTVELIFQVLNLAIILRVLLSWIHIDPGNRVADFIYQVTEPILAPLRRILPTVSGIDFSPFVAVILLDVAERVIVSLLV